MESTQLFMTDEVKIGKKGQITIPKKIRDMDKLNESDVLTLKRMPGGSMILEKQKIKTPEDRLIEIVKKVPRFGWKKAWEEVKAERKLERS